MCIYSEGSAGPLLTIWQRYKHILIQDKENYEEALKGLKEKDWQYVAIGQASWDLYKGVKQVINFLRIGRTFEPLFFVLPYFEMWLTYILKIWLRMKKLQTYGRLITGKNMISMIHFLELAELLVMLKGMLMFSTWLNLEGYFYYMLVLLL